MNILFINQSINLSYNFKRGIPRTIHGLGAIKGNLNQFNLIITVFKTFKTEEIRQANHLQMLKR